MTRVLAALAIVAGLGAGWYAFSEPHKAGPPQRGALVRATLLTPMVDGAIMAKQYDEVPVEYELVNTGDQPLHNLQPRMCGCQVERPAAKLLKPGETTRLVVKLKANHLGTLSPPVALIADGHDTPLAVLRPVILVPIEPPVVLRKPDFMRMTVCSGRPQSAVLQIASVESADSKPVLEGMESRPGSFFTIREGEVLEKRTVDPKLVERTYHFQLVIGRLPIGVHRNELRVHTSNAKLAETLEPILVEVTVKPRLSIVPPEIHLKLGKNGRGSQRVVVVDLAGEANVQVGKYDEDSIRLKRISDTEGRLLMFDITAVQSADSGEIFVPFATPDGSSTARLTVSIDK